jgi:hypothetical protein
MNNTRQKWLDNFRDARLVSNFSLKWGTRLQEV